MKDLLPAIKTALHASLLVADDDIYITPDVKWRPELTGVPCIGIHDSGLSRDELAGEVWEITATVDIAAFAALTADGYSGLTGTAGVYAILDEVTDILVDNLLSVSGVQRVQVGNDSASSLYQAPDADNTWLITITRSFVYTIERSSI